MILSVLDKSKIATKLLSIHLSRQPSNRNLSPKSWNDITVAHSTILLDQVHTMFTTVGKIISDGLEIMVMDGVMD